MMGLSSEFNCDLEVWRSRNVHSKQILYHATPIYQGAQQMVVRGQNEEYRANSIDELSRELTKSDSFKAALRGNKVRLISSRDLQISPEGVISEKVTWVEIINMYKRLVYYSQQNNQ